MIRPSRGRGSRPAAAWRSPAAGRTRRSRRACAAAPASPCRCRRRRPRRASTCSRSYRRSCRSISTNVPDIGRSDQRISALTWNSAEQSLAAMLAGDQRRAVFERGPAPGRKHRIGLGQHLPAHGDVLRHGEARERTVGGERSEMLRLLPGQAAAERAAAAAQLDRHEIVVGLRQPRAGEAHQHAALVDPGREPVADFRRQRADVGHHDHRQLLVEELRHRLLRRAPCRRAARRRTARARG